MQKSKPKKRKINKVNLWAIIVSCLAMFAFICVICGIIFLAVLLKDRPSLNLQDFEQTESSIVYDSNGDEIANLGTVIRQNVEYNELPNCVVDAFVAIEDSRFFEHNGFDLPRFTKAILENLRTMSFGQGGSTFTMQLVKNTYFTNDDTGEEASRSGVSGIKRKVQEIALALELEKYEPKQFIFESYLNKLNYGGTRNIRGIQKAAQYYFSKDVSQLNLNEAAFLAGVINGPYYYSPFTQDSDGTYHIKEAQERTEEVLYQMYNHGYISKSEYEIAKTVQIKDLLTDPNSSSQEEGDGINYQAYVDAVVNEAIELTGMDPYTTTMNIYTYMNKDIQSVMDDIQTQGKDDYVGFPDEYMEAASVCIDNSTGQIVAILGGRNYANGGQLLLNHATEQYKQPGSSIKPILDYALAFENLGWATDHVLVDQPIYMDSSNQNIVFNFQGEYHGDSTLKEAVGNSSNSCAIQTLQSVLDKMKYEYVVNYAQSLGYKFNLDKFNIQYAIGGSSCEVTPLQHAAAYASLFNSGTYNTPHTISRIEFTNGKSPITPVYESKQVISEQAAYLTTELMKSNVQSYGGSYSYVKNDDYTVYGKTGTTDWSTAGLDYGIPAGANKDAWLIAATSEYTTATWIGYEKAVAGQQSYITDDCYFNIRPQARIAHLVLDACYEYGDSKPSEITKPSDISSITHILGAGYYDEKKGNYIYYSTTDDIYNNGLITKTTGLIKSGLNNVYTYNSQANEIKDYPKGSKASLIGDDYSRMVLALNWKEFTGKDNDSSSTGKEEAKSITLSIPSGSYSFNYVHRHYFDESWVFGGVVYAADIYVDGEKVDTVVSDDADKNFTLGDLRYSDTIDVDFYYKYENNNITSKSERWHKDIEDTTIDLKTPKPGSSIEDVESWCDYNDISFTKKDADTSHPNGTFIIKYDNVNYEAGSTIRNLKFKDFSKISCTYYVGKESQVTIVGTGKDNEYTIHLDGAEVEHIKWIADGDCKISGEDNKKTVKIELDDDFESGSLSVIVVTKDGVELDDSININIE